MMPLGLMAFSSSAVVLYPITRENTSVSRTRRAISSEYWEPKSRITIAGWRFVSPMAVGVTSDM